MNTAKISLWGLCTLTALASFSVSASVATYRLTVVNEWNPTDYPNNYPSNGHFSNLGGGTHELGQSFWQPGTLASSQIETMAEAGNVIPLASQITAAGGSELRWQQWFCRAGFSAASCGTTVKTFTVDSAKPAITIATMIAPTPDWYVGVSALNLRPGGVWAQFIEVPLPMWDAGTEQGNRPITGFPASVPPELIGYVTYNAGTGFYESTTSPDIVGSFTFELLSVEGDDDTDGDGVDDTTDNCLVILNADQNDSNSDGFGNACDADTNNDCIINFLRYCLVLKCVFGFRC